MGRSSVGFVYGFPGNCGRKYPKGPLVIKFCVKYVWCPFFCQNIMICARSDKIITEFTYTYELPPIFVEKFCKVRRMITSQKDHIK